MEQTWRPTTPETAIPARFVDQRERVLRILRRWERSVAASTLRLRDAN